MLADAPNRRRNEVKQETAGESVEKQAEEREEEFHLATPDERSLKPDEASLQHELEGAVDKAIQSLPEKQRLMHFGQELADTDRLRDCFIEAETTLHLIIDQEDLMEIFVDSLTNRLSLIVSPKETIAAVKAKVEAQTGLPAASQILSLRRTELGDHETLEQHEVDEDTYLHLETKPS